MIIVFDFQLLCYHVYNNYKEVVVGSENHMVTYIHLCVFS